MSDVLVGYSTVGLAALLRARRHMRKRELRTSLGWYSTVADLACDLAVVARAVQPTSCTVSTS